jgi:hypothetical protein
VYRIKGKEKPMRAYPGMNQFEEEICAGESGLSVKRCGRTEDVKKHAEAGLAF